MAACSFATCKSGLGSLCSAARNAAGPLAMAYAGVSNVTLLLLNDLLQSWRWPLFGLVGSSCLLVSAGMAAALAWTRAAPPGPRQAPWVLLRGFFGTAGNVLLTVAVLLGAPVGDAGALASVNVVAAALLGRLVLGEPLRWVHAVVSLLSVAGALLVSRPSFLFGASAAATGSVGLGYCLAMAGGCSRACQYISSRKCPSVPTAYMSFSAMVQRGLAYWLFAVFRPSQGVAARFRTSAWEEIGWVLLLALITGTGNYCQSAGSQLCAAAVSATVYQTVFVGIGYAAQVALLGRMPRPETLAGAGLLVAAVILVALARASRAAPDRGASCSPGVPSTPRRGLSETASSDLADGTAESLASFAAAEFVETSPHSVHGAAPDVRRRRPGAADSPAAAAAGAAVAVSAFAIGAVAEA